ncbi:MAG: hypothetical protein RR704_22420, partial [Stenotrophomonas sp.]
MATFLAGGVPIVELKAAAGAAANVACDGPKGAGQDDRHSRARLLLLDSPLPPGNNMRHRKFISTGGYMKSIVAFSLLLLLTGCGIRSEVVRVNVPDIRV